MFVYLFCWIALHDCLLMFLVFHYMHTSIHASCIFIYIHFMTMHYTMINPLILEFVCVYLLYTLYYYAVCNDISVHLVCFFGYINHIHVFNWLYNNTPMLLVFCLYFIWSHAIALCYGTSMDVYFHMCLCDGSYYWAIRLPSKAPPHKTTKLNIYHLYLCCI